MIVLCREDQWQQQFGHLQQLQAEFCEQLAEDCQHVVCHGRRDLNLQMYDDCSDLAVILAWHAVIQFAPLVFNCSFPVCADVVFFHGLLGGPFITWRQQDRPAKRLSLAAAGKHNSVDSDCTACWPKVLLSYQFYKAEDNVLINWQYFLHSWQHLQCFDTVGWASGRASGL